MRARADLCCVLGVEVAVSSPFGNLVATPGGLCLPSGPFSQAGPSPKRARLAGWPLNGNDFH